MKNKKKKESSPWKLLQKQTTVQCYETIQIYDLFLLQTNAEMMWLEPHKNVISCWEIFLFQLKNWKNFRKREGRYSKSYLIKSD